MDRGLFQEEKEDEEWDGIDAGLPCSFGCGFWCGSERIGKSGTVRNGSFVDIHAAE